MTPEELELAKYAADLRRIGMSESLIYKCKKGLLEGPYSNLLAVRARYMS
jgi:hypothetical protein